MAIIQTVNFSAFKSAFVDMGRGSQFSDCALEALFNHIEEQSDDLGEPYELDVIELCCDYSEETVEDVLDAEDREQIRSDYLDSLGDGEVDDGDLASKPDFDEDELDELIYEAAMAKLESEGRLVTQLDNNNFLTKD